MLPQSYQLVMRSGPNPGKTYPLNKNEISIGRDTTNDVIINDAEVSRKHAHIVSQGGGFVLEDLGSTNGTFVDGQRLMGPHQLRSGEMIMLGENISLAFEAPQIDPNATVIASPVVREGPPLTTRQEVPPAFQPVTPPPPEPAFAGQVPPGPVEEFEPPASVPSAAPRRSSARTWLLAGCGCLIILICLLAVGAYAFDALNLYCKVPVINSFFTCPPAP